MGKNPTPILYHKTTINTIPKIKKIKKSANFFRISAGFCGGCGFVAGEKQQIKAQIAKIHEKVWSATPLSLK